jgi:hypothetical protein
MLGVMHRPCLCKPCRLSRKHFVLLLCARIGFNPPA